MLKTKTKTLSVAELMKKLEGLPPDYSVEIHWVAGEPRSLRRLVLEKEHQRVVLVPHPAY
jgi:hypothetical protein